MCATIVLSKYSLVLVVILCVCSKINRWVDKEYIRSIEVTDYLEVNWIIEWELLDSFLELSNYETKIHTEKGLDIYICEKFINYTSTHRY